MALSHMSSPLARPVVILVEPQLASNMGHVARAMLNFGCRELRLVNPQQDPLSTEARALAAGADVVLEQAVIYPSYEQALADLHFVVATAATLRYMIKPSATPRVAAERVQQHLDSSHRVGLVFGRERTGLTNDELAEAHLHLQIPTNPDFSSLNLGQAVLLVLYEWFLASTSPKTIPTPMPEVAPREEMLGFLQHLEEELHKAGYFRTGHKRPIMRRSLHTLFMRQDLNSQEVRTLRGIISTLTNPNGIYSRPPKRKKSTETN
ncbi:MAG: RNA methyltransferase [Holosporales bacterium]